MNNIKTDKIIREKYLSEASSFDKEALWNKLKENDTLVNNVAHQERKKKKGIFFLLSLISILLVTGYIFLTYLTSEQSIEAITANKATAIISSNEQLTSSSEVPAPDSEKSVFTSAENQNIIEKGSAIMPSQTTQDNIILSKENAIDVGQIDDKMSTNEVSYSLRSHSVSNKITAGNSSGLSKDQDGLFHNQLFQKQTNDQLLNKTHLKSIKEQMLPLLIFESDIRYLPVRSNPPLQDLGMASLTKSFKTVSQFGLEFNVCAVMFNQAYNSELPGEQELTTRLNAHLTEKMGTSFELLLKYNLTNNVFLGTGIEYQQLYERFDYSNTVYVKTYSLQSDTASYYRVDNQLIYQAGTVEARDYEQRDVSHANTYRSVSIPLYLGYTRTLNSGHRLALAVHYSHNVYNRISGKSLDALGNINAAYKSKSRYSNVRGLRLDYTVPVDLGSVSVFAKYKVGTLNNGYTNSQITQDLQTYHLGFSIHKSLIK